MHAVKEEDQLVDLKFTAAPGQNVEICFEPVGTTFSLSDGQSIYLRTEAKNLASVEIVSWPNGIGVWVPYPGNYAILDADGMELDQL
jgi:hypothetical protein